MENSILKQQNLKTFFCIILPLVFCVVLSLIRISIAKDFFFLFLIWNAVLALIPLVISYFIYCKNKMNNFFFILAFGLWLLFFPNAPYILTDIIHLKVAEKRLQWFDLILVFSYSLTGLIYAFLSLHLIEKIFRNRFNIKKTFFITAAVLYLSAFGIYLGRFLRWNSWDIFSNMREVLDDVFVRFTNPITHVEVWQFTFLFGTFLTVFYFVFTRLTNTNNRRLEDV